MHLALAKEMEQETDFYPLVQQALLGFFLMSAVSHLPFLEVVNKNNNCAINLRSSGGHVLA